MPVPLAPRSGRAGYSGVRRDAESDDWRGAAGAGALAPAEEGIAEAACVMTSVGALFASSAAPVLLMLPVVVVVLAPVLAASRRTRGSNSNAGTASW